LVKAPSAFIQFHQVWPLIKFLTFVLFGGKKRKNRKKNKVGLTNAFGIVQVFQSIALDSGFKIVLVSSQPASWIRDDDFTSMRIAKQRHLHILGLHSETRKVEIKCAIAATN
jgi:hypothetical protein